MTTEKKRPDYEALRKTLEFFQEALADKIDDIESSRRSTMLVRPYELFLPLSVLGMKEDEKEALIMGFNRGFMDGVCEIISRLESWLRKEAEDYFENPTFLVCPECGVKEYTGVQFYDSHGNMFFEGARCPHCGYHREFEWHRYCMATGNVKEEDE